MSQKRVLVVANDFTAVFHFRMELLKGMLDEGYHVMLALPEDERNGALAPVVSQLIHIPLSRFGTNPLQDLKTYFALRRIIRRQRPDAVLTFTAKPNVYGGLAASAQKVPYVATVTGLGSNFYQNNLISKIMIGLERLAFGRAKRVFFQNEYNMALLNSHGVALHNSALVPGSGVNIEVNRYEPYPQQGPTRFLVAGRIRQDKGFDELFEAIRQVRREGLEAEFQVIGWYEEERYKPLVEEMKQRYGVVFHEYVPHDQMHDHIAACHCLIQPSHHEGMSNIVLEAAATGRPCLVSNIHGCKEAVAEGETGYLFEVKNAQDLVDKIRLFLRMDIPERARMGRAARRLMEERFDRNQVVQMYLREINRS